MDVNIVLSLNTGAGGLQGEEPEVPGVGEIVHAPSWTGGRDCARSAIVERSHIRQTFSVFTYPVLDTLMIGTCGFVRLRRTVCVHEGRVAISLCDEIRMRTVFTWGSCALCVYGPFFHCDPSPAFALAMNCSKSKIHSPLLRGVISRTIASVCRHRKT